MSKGGSQQPKRGSGPSQKPAHPGGAAPGPRPHGNGVAGVSRPLVDGSDPLSGRCWTYNRAMKAVPSMYGEHSFCKPQKSTELGRRVNFEAATACPLYSASFYGTPVPAPSILGQDVDQFTGATASSLLGAIMAYKGLTGDIDWAELAADWDEVRNAGLFGATADSAVHTMDLLGYEVNVALQMGKYVTPFLLDGSRTAEGLGPTFLLMRDGWVLMADIPWVHTGGSPEMAEALEVHSGHALAQMWRIRALASKQASLAGAEEVAQAILLTEEENDWGALMAHHFTGLATIFRNTVEAEEAEAALVLYNFAESQTWLDEHQRTCGALLDEFIQTLEKVRRSFDRLKPVPRSPWPHRDGAFERMPLRPAKVYCVSTQAPPRYLSYIYRDASLVWVCPTGNVGRLGSEVWEAESAPDWRRVQVDCLDKFTEWAGANHLFFLEANQACLVGAEVRPENTFVYSLSGEFALSGNPLRQTKSGDYELSQLECLYAEAETYQLSQWYTKEFQSQTMKVAALKVSVSYWTMNRIGEQLLRVRRLVNAVGLRVREDRWPALGSVVAPTEDAKYRTLYSLYKRLLPEELRGIYTDMRNEEFARETRSGVEPSAVAFNLWSMYLAMPPITPPTAPSSGAPHS